MNLRLLVLITVFGLPWMHQPPAMAAAVQPVEWMTRALSAYYVSLVQCVDASRQPQLLQTKITEIRDYVALLYPAGIPHWALPEDAGIIEDEATCGYLVNERSLSYHNARQYYARHHPKKGLPPAAYTDRTESAAIVKAAPAVRIDTKPRRPTTNDREKSFGFEW